jgi:hypothetical protein
MFISILLLYIFKTCRTHSFDSDRFQSSLPQWSLLPRLRGCGLRGPPRGIRGLDPGLVSDVALSPDAPKALTPEGTFIMGSNEGEADEAPRGSLSARRHRRSPCWAILLTGACR